MEEMEEENSCPFVPLDTALGGPRPVLGVWGSHARSRSFLRVAVQIKNKRQSKGNNVKIKRVSKCNW